MVCKSRKEKLKDASQMKGFVAKGICMPAFSIFGIAPLYLVVLVVRLNEKLFYATTNP